MKFFAVIYLPLLSYNLVLASTDAQPGANCPPSEQPTTNLSQANTAGLECVYVNPQDWPKKEDCINAILQTPESSDLAAFGTGADVPVEYRLPQSHDSGKCRLSFELLSGVDQEMSSWLRLNHAADRLIFACAPGVRTKGSILVGRIKITSVKVSNPRPGSCASVEVE